MCVLTANSRTSDPKLTCCEYMLWLCTAPAARHPVIVAAASLVVAAPVVVAASVVAASPLAAKWPCTTPAARHFATVVARSVVAASPVAANG